MKKKLPIKLIIPVPLSVIPIVPKIILKNNYRYLKLPLGYHYLKQYKTTTAKGNTCLLPSIISVVPKTILKTSQSTTRGPA